MTKYKLNLNIFFLLVLTLLHRLDAKDTIFKNASHFWPLDYVTGIKDVVTSTEATLYRMGGVSLKGSGNGYMEIQLGTSAMRLGTLSGSCLTKLRPCQSGFTMSFWIRLSSVRESSENDRIDVVTIASSGNANLISIELLIGKGQNSSLVYTLNDGEFQHKAKCHLPSSQWIHLTMVANSSGDFLIFVNGRHAASSVRKKFQSEIGKSWVIMIGSLLRLGSYKGPIVDLDEIAIWNSRLSSLRISGIITRQVQIKAQKTCQGNRTSLAVAWQSPLDIYNQIMGYDVAGISRNGSFLVSKPADATMAIINNLNADTLYSIRVIARTLSGFIIESNAIHCFTNQTRSTSPLETGLQLISLSSHEIRVILKGLFAGKNNVFLVSYASYGKPAVNNQVFSEGYLNYTISNLSEDTEYTVTVTFYLSSGEKIYKNSVMTKKIVKLPVNPIHSLVVVSISWNTASLQWLPPRDYDDPALRYQVICNGREVLTTATPSVTLKGLESNRNYTVGVKAGAIGLGFQDRATSITFKTIERFPTPTEVKIANVTWNSAIIKWKAVRMQEKVFYRISYHSDRGKRRSFIVSSQRNTSFHRQRLMGLEQLTGYSVYVQSGNGTLFGKSLKLPVYFKTKEKTECLDVSHDCPKGSKCLRVRGSYLCNCLPDYYFKDGNCVALGNAGPVCKTSIERSIKWGRTLYGQTVMRKCPRGTEGIAKRYCKRFNATKAIWLPPDLSGCVSSWLIEFNEKMKSGGVDSSILMQSLASSYKKQTKFVGGDIQMVLNTLDAIVGMSFSSGKASLESTAENLVEITDDLLSSQSSKTWRDLPKTQQIKSAANIMNTVEQMANVYATSLSFQGVRENSLTISKPNSVLQVKSIGNASDQSFSDDRLHKTKLGSIIIIPVHSIEQKYKGSMSVYFGAFRNIENLLGAKLDEPGGESNTTYVTGSNVVAATLFPAINRTFEKPIVIIHRIPKVNSSVTLTCVFWKYSSNGSGSWSSEGCKLKDHNTTHATCHCFHLTNFNVLMSVTKAPTEINVLHEKRIYWITFACICISLLALLIAFITFCSVKALKSSRNTTHKHLVVALFFAQLLFLVGIDKTANMIVCRAIGAVLHYLFLVAFTLMGLEGFVLYMMLVRVHSSSRRMDHRKLLAACWAIPIIIVSITLAINYRAYGNDRYCWLTYKRGFIWSFVGPVLFIILINLVFMVLAIRVMAEKSRKREMLSQEIWYWIKCCSMLVTILGLCWIVGIFYINQESIVVAYIFSILNALQGFAIFIFLCLLDPRVKDTYLKIFCCKKRDKASISSRTMSATKSTLPSSRFKENRDSTVRSRTNAEEIKVLRNSKAVSMEYQEIVVTFSEEDLSCNV